MAILNPTLRVNYSNKDNEIVNTIKTFDFYNKACQVMNFNDYDLRLLHHNIQSLNIKLLDISMMLRVDNLNVNFYVLQNIGN